jgi:16S rRNA (cytosine1402-N4)-methyltransferase
MNKYHTSVLLQEVLTTLSIKTGGFYIDGTLGGGGHALSILEKGGRILGIDQDQEALDFARERLSTEGFKEKEDFWIAKANFSQIDVVAGQMGRDSVDGILLDIGVSGHQLDSLERGFSFRGGPLDMRMDKEQSVSARELVNGLTKGELEELFMRFGEEPRAKQYASAIVEARKHAPLENAQDLVRIIGGRMGDGAHPATKVFQALRILVNDELNVLHIVIPKAFDLLAQNGRLAIITFHSLEDRIVKQAFNELVELGKGSLVNEKPIVPTEEEVLLNKRSRSSKLRVIEKISLGSESVQR